MQFLGLVQRKAADCHKSQDALHLLKELGSFQAELLPSQQRRLDEMKVLVRNHGMMFVNVIVINVITNVVTYLSVGIYAAFGVVQVRHCIKNNVSFCFILLFHSFSVFEV